MQLARFGRRDYISTLGPTPLHPLSRLTELLGGPNIYVKRDDLLMGLAGGGNKTRKLEFLVADALAQGADTLITCGAIQSNHCRLTAAAAAKEGLRCRLVLEERTPGTYNPAATGNNLLYHILGVDNIRVVPAGTNLAEAMAEEAKEATAHGYKPYVIPLGGSSPIGAMGYAACALEILAQAFQAGIRVDYVVVASGSAGTHSGLLVGFHALNSDVTVIGINVSRRNDQHVDVVYQLATATAEHLGLRGEITRQAVVCFDEYLGAGYAAPTPEMMKAVKTVAQTESIILDPVYTGKAMSGLIGLVERGYFSKNDNVVFLHTGGIPGLFAQSAIFLNN